MEPLTKERAAVCLLDDPTPVAYLNIYEEGDVWVKINNCEGCSRRGCCGDCPMLSSIGCYWHLENPGRSHKPYVCVVYPYPDTRKPYCQLEFRCVQGSREGYIRRVRENRNVFEEKTV